MENEIIHNEIDTEECQELKPFVIPNIYKYSPVTKEYLYSVPAEKDPEESKKQGYFVPLVPANATLAEPPEYGENEAAVYSKTVETGREEFEVTDEETGKSHTEYKDVKTVTENWTIEPDYRKNFLKVDEYLNVFDITTIGEQEGYIVVEKEIGEEIKTTPNRFKIVDSEIVKKPEEEYKKEELEMAKSEKHTENTVKAKAAIENGYVVFKAAEFETNAQTVGDLTATMLMLQTSGQETYNWLSRDDKVVELTVEDFVTLGALIAGYKNSVWNDKYLTYKNAITKAKTVSSVAKITIDYGV